MFSKYEAALSRLLDTFIPVRSIRSRYCPATPWFNESCRTLRRRARRLERVFRRTRCPADRASCVRFVRKMHSSYRTREREYWEALIFHQSKEPKRLWTTFSSLLGRGRGGRAPTNLHVHVPLFSAEIFLERFTAKISSILRSTADFSPPTFSTTEHRLSVLQNISITQLRRPILSAPPKSCELDPILTFILQEVIDDLLTFLTALCNSSIREASLPDSQKRSILLPVIKQDGLDQSDPANYRPIANVTFLSKILERIVANQLISYLDANEMFPSNQSGFRRNHSTETLLLRLLSDFYSAMDRGHVTLLALFDVSSAFDSVDHSILIQRLTTSFGLVDQPLAWLKSFLYDRSSCVVIGPSRSSWVPAPFGAPQGSVLGPLLYLLFTADIGPWLTKLGVLHHLFADGVQVYVHTDPLAAETVLMQMSQAIDVLTSWMAANRLLLNPSKTQAIWLGGHRQLAKIDGQRLSSLFPHIAFSTCVRDL